jgi:hypothetical protein
MSERTWRLSSPGAGLRLLLTSEGALLRTSLVDRRKGREWIHARLPADEILLAAARPGGEPVTLTGASGWDLRGARETEDGDWRTLRLSLASRALPLVVHRHIVVHARHSFVREWTEVQNAGTEPLLLSRVDTFRMRLAPTPDDLTLRWLNNYCRGLKPRPSHPVHSRSVGENVRATIETGPYSPDCAWFTLSPPGDAEGLVGGWEWSGPMVVCFGDDGGPCLVSGGLATEGMSEEIPPGASFTAPAGWYGFYDGSLDEASHRAQLFTTLVAPPPVSWKNYPPLGYCTWAASLDEEKGPRNGGSHPWFPTEENLLSQVDAAAEAGFELFILDYGWFPRVGDWWCDPVRFPDGPRRIVRAVKDRGMRLGVWMGFASVDPGAAVAREHPEWLATYNGAPIPEAFPLRCSAQVWGTQVLCLGHAPARAWMKEQVLRVIGELEVDWFKHDFDTVTLCQSHGHTHTAGDGRIDMARGFYEVLDAVRARFPATIIDNWESDSALPDYGMIRRHGVHLIGDAYEAFLLRQMFYGASRLFPPRMLHRYLRLEDSDLDLRASMRSAMIGGPLTLLSDPRGWTASQKADFAAEAALYKRVRRLFVTGAMYCPFGRPRPGAWDAFQFAGRKAGVLFAFRNGAPQESLRVPLRGLDPGARYSVTLADGGRPRTVSGARLLSPGLALGTPAPAGALVAEYREAAEEKR